MIPGRGGIEAEALTLGHVAAGANDLECGLWAVKDSAVLFWCKARGRSKQIQSSTEDSVVLSRWLQMEEKKALR